MQTCPLVVTVVLFISINIVNVGIVFLLLRLVNSKDLFALKTRRLVKMLIGLVFVLASFSLVTETGCSYGARHGNVYLELRLLPRTIDFVGMVKQVFLFSLG